MKQKKNVHIHDIYISIIFIQLSCTFMNQYLRTIISDRCVRPFWVRSVHLELVMLLMYYIEGLQQFCFKITVTLLFEHVVLNIHSIYTFIKVNEISVRDTLSVMRTAKSFGLTCGQIFLTYRFYQYWYLLVQLGQLGGAASISPNFQLLSMVPHDSIVILLMKESKH